MAAWFLHTGLYLLALAVVLVGGLLLVYWGLWGDRSKGRPRCPNCWCDMRGTLPGLECPACGHNAREEQRLYRDRRVWWRIVVGVTLVLLSAYPLVIVAGWYRERLRIQSEQSSIQKLSDRGHWVLESSRYAAWGPTGGVVRRAESVWLTKSGTDTDLAECGKLSQVDHLRLEGTHVTDAGLVHLRGLSQLRFLNLDDTQVTDVGLVHFKGLSRLAKLELSGTQVTDAGLDHLSNLTQLWSLGLADTSVTEAGVAKLEQALPNVRVIRWRARRPLAHQPLNRATGVAW